MGIFTRLFNIGKAEANSAIDKLEDPIKMTEQGIRDLKIDLDKSLQALAEVKAYAIRSKKDYKSYSEQAKDYEKKAMLLVQRGEDGTIEAAEAERLALEALTKKSEAEQQAARAKEEVDKFEVNINNLDANVKKLRSMISKYENELKTLKARDRVSKATAKINKQVAGIDSNSTVSMLERMKDKVNQQEALAEAYGEIAGESKSVDDEIEKALGGSKASASADLAALKAKMKASQDGNI